MNEKRAARDARVENYKNRKDMIRAFKTVVNAQERLVLRSIYIPTFFAIAIA